jgi:hypothetical protein
MAVGASRRCKVLVRTALLGVIGVIAVFVAPTEVSAAAPPWGACGLNAKPDKEVCKFSSHVLRCGGPKYSRTPEWGYRHILWRHKADFERLAVGTNQNWRDVADLAMDHISSDADSVAPADGGKTCNSRVIFLHDLQTNQLVRQQIVVMITNAAGNIITAYPSSKQC